MKKTFRVSFIATSTGFCQLYDVEALCERTAMEQALKLAGLRETEGVEVDVRLRESDKARGTDEASDFSCKVPGCGWIVKVTSADRKVSDKQYLVAVKDAQLALRAVEPLVSVDASLTLGPSVESRHLVRRRMVRGDVLELRTGRAPLIRMAGPPDGIG